MEVDKDLNQNVDFYYHCFFPLKVDFILANSADTDEMLLHLGHHCLQKYLFRGFQSTKG